MISELSEAGHELIEEQNVQAVIRSLPQEWDYMKVQLTQNFNMITFDDVVHHLELVSLNILFFCRLMTSLT